MCLNVPPPAAEECVQSAGGRRERRRGKGASEWHVQLRGNFLEMEHL